MKIVGIIEEVELITEDKCVNYDICIWFCGNLLI